MTPTYLNGIMSNHRGWDVFQTNPVAKMTAAIAVSATVLVFGPDFDSQNGVATTLPSDSPLFCQQIWRDKDLNLS